MGQFIGLVLVAAFLGLVLAEGLDQAAIEGERIQNTPGYTYGAP